MSRANPYIPGLRAVVGNGLPGRPIRDISGSVFKVGDTHISEVALPGAWIAADGGPWDDRLDASALTVQIAGAVRLMPGLDQQPTDYTRKALDFSPSGDFLAVGISNITQPRIYKRSGDSFNRLLTGVPTASLTGYSAKFSPDESYVVFCGSGTSPGNLHIWLRDGDVFTRSAATTPIAVFTDVDVSPDSAHIALGCSSDNSPMVYKRSGDSFSRLTSGVATPYTSSNGVAYSPDGAHLYVVAGSSVSSSLAVLKRSGDTYTEITPKPTTPGGIPQCVAASPDGRFVAVGTDTAPFLRLYSRNGDSLTLLAATGYEPSVSVFDLAFSPDGSTLFASGGTQLNAYSLRSGALSIAPSLVGAPLINLQGVAISPTGKFAATATGNSQLGQYVQLYKAALPNMQAASPDVARIKVG